MTDSAYRDSDITALLNRENINNQLQTVLTDIEQEVSQPNSELITKYIQYCLHKRIGSHYHNSKESHRKRRLHQ